MNAPHESTFYKHFNALRLLLYLYDFLLRPNNFWEQHSVDHSNNRILHFNSRILQAFCTHLSTGLWTAFRACAESSVMLTPRIRQQPTEWVLFAWVTTLERCTPPNWKNGARLRREEHFCVWMVLLHFRSRGRIRAGGERILEGEGEIRLPLAENLYRSGTHVQVFRQRWVDFAARLQNSLSAGANPRQAPQPPLCFFVSFFVRRENDAATPKSPVKSRQVNRVLGVHWTQRAIFHASIVSLRQENHFPRPRSFHEKWNSALRND